MKSQKDKNKNRKRRALGITAGIALCTLILGTFAWDLYQDSVDNKFGNAAMQGSVEVEEIFEDPHMTPGKEIKKEIWLNNTSSTPTFVRATFEEKFTKLISDGSGNAVIEQYPDSQVNNTGNYLPTTNANAVPVIVDALTVKDKSDNNSSGDEFDDWKDVTSKVTFAGGKPADVTVYAKSRKETTNIVGGGTQTKVTTDYIAVRKFALANAHLGEVSEKLVVKYPGSATDVAQQVTGTFKPVYNEVTGDTTYTFDNVVFNFYQGMTAEISKDWPTEIPLATDIDKSLVDSNISLKYSSFLVSPITQHTWFYNEDDGYFYWMDVLASGAKTDEFLAAVQLDASVGTEYDYLDYTLKAIGEGVITNMAAVESEWNLQSGDQVYDFLEGLPNVTPAP